MNKLLLTYLFLVVSVFAQNGIIKSYYPNGKVHTQESYVDDVKDGAFYTYYENGNLAEEKNFSSGVLNGWIRTFYESGLLREEVYIENGIRNGVDKLYYGNGALAQVRSYKNGKLIKIIKLDYDSTYVAPADAFVGSNQKIINKKSDEIICNVFECPVPIGGMAAIERKIVYPKHAKLYGLEGDVLLIAKIDTSGKVVSTKVLRTLGLGCDEAAEKAVKETRFFPGKDKNGKTVEALATLKVNFSLGRKKHLVSAKKTTRDFSEFVSKEIYDNKKIVAATEEKSSGIKEKKDISNKVTEVKKTARREKEKENSSRKNEIIQTAVKPKKKKINHREPLIPARPRITCLSSACATPVGGVAALQKQFKIPKRVIEKGIRGVVVIQVSIDKYGYVKDTKIIKGLPYGANDAAEVAVLYTHFTPAIKDGEKVESILEITLPVSY